MVLSMKNIDEPVSFEGYLVAQNFGKLETTTELRVTFYPLGQPPYFKPKLGASALNLGFFYENETYHYTSPVIENPSGNSVKLELVSDADIFGLEFEPFEKYFKLSLPLNTISIGMKYIKVNITDSVTKSET